MFHLKLFLAAAVASIAAVPIQAGLEDRIIFNRCANAMRAEYTKARKQLLLSDLNTTCRCVVNKINNHESIEQAKNDCIN